MVNLRTLHSHLIWDSSVIMLFMSMSLTWFLTDSNAKILHVIFSSISILLHIFENEKYNILTTWKKYIYNKMELLKIIQLWLQGLKWINQPTNTIHRLRASWAMRVTINLITTLLNTEDSLSMVTMHGYKHGINNNNKPSHRKIKYEILTRWVKLWSYLCVMR